MEHVLSTVLNHAKAKVGSLMLMDESVSLLRIVEATGFPSDTLEAIKKFTLNPGQGVAGHVYLTGQPYYLRHPQEDALFVPPPIPFGPNFQFLSLPLKDANGQTVGVLNIHFPTDALMGAKELEGLAQLANLATSEFLARFGGPARLPC